MPPRNRDRSAGARDYYFHIAQERVDEALVTFVYLTSASYFDRTGAQSDWALTEILGGGFLADLGLYEEMEGVFSTDPSSGRADIRDTLAWVGFRESPAFSAYMSKQPAATPSRVAWNIVGPPLDEPPVVRQPGRRRAPTAWERLLDDD